MYNLVDINFGAVINTYCNCELFRKHVFIQNGDVHHTVILFPGALDPRL